MLLFALLLAACGDNKDKQGKALDTPTTGEITIIADDGYRPIIETSLHVFHSIYRNAKIHPIFASEGEAVSALLNDSVRVIVITRQLTEEENKYFQARGFTPKVTPIAYDAIAFILHPSNKDTVFTKEQMGQILTGAVTRWPELNPKSPLSDIQLVFDHPLSGTLRYVKDSVLMGQAISPKASALKNNVEVIDYVSKHPNALGIISANWISDTDDEGRQSFLKTIKLADIAEAPGKEGYGPYQAYLAEGTYPYKRTVYVVNAQARNGLGLGFASYLAADGQRIVLKDGLLPVNAVTRLIKATR
ncbi:MAG: substrate-binding domain-containing protein [Saprospiraceae bacterium]|nr:substrate-binding domain-containing protein [Saprospiraceae bacterium]